MDRQDPGPDIWGDASRVPPRRARVLFAAAYAAWLAVNGASAAGLLGPTNAEVSARFETPLTPEGWAFSIWGLIFVLMGAGAAYALDGRGYGPDGHKARYFAAVAWPWAAAWAATAAWQFAFAAATPGGMAAGAALVACAAAAAARAARALRAARARFGASGAAADYAAFFLPSSILAAWLSVAAAAQLLVAARARGWGEADLAAPAAAGAAAAAAAGVWMELAHRDTAYGLTLVWALVAVFERQRAAAPAAAGAALAGVAALVLAAAASVLRRRGGGGGSSGGGGGGDEAERQALIRGEGLA